MSVIGDSLHVQTGKGESPFVFANMLVRTRIPASIVPLSLLASASTRLSSSFTTRSPVSLTTSNAYLTAACCARSASVRAFDAASSPLMQRCLALLFGLIGGVRALPNALLSVLFFFFLNFFRASAPFSSSSNSSSNSSTSSSSHSALASSPSVDSNVSSESVGV